MKFAKSALETRFGVRILGAFMASAILPMLIFAALAYVSTRDQLEEDALVSLRRDVKSATMSIAEQINLGRAQLDLALASPERRSAGAATAFSRIDLLDLGALDLTANQQAHLHRGEPLLVVGDALAGGIRLMKSIDGQLIVGTFDAEFLYKPERLSEGERYWVTDQKRRYLFGVSSDGHTQELASSIEDPEPRTPFDLKSTTGVELALIWPLFLKHPYFSSELHVGMSRTKRSIHAPLQEFRSDFVTALLLAFLGSIAIALYQIRIRVRPLNEIVRATNEIENGNFAHRASISSGDEFEQLGSSVDAMARKLGEDFEVLETLRIVSNTLLDATNREVIANQVIPAAIQFANASAGVLFVVDRESSDTSRPLVEVDENGMVERTRSGEESALSDFAKQAFDNWDFVYVHSSGDDGRETCARLARAMGIPIEAALAIPLFSNTGEVEGVVELFFNGSSTYDHLGTAVNRSLSILAGQAGAALKNIAWVEDLRGLFEGVIRLTVNAIDEKSPYTGDHCRRVPLIAEMIADAVCADEAGPLKDFYLSERDRYELKIAALLHDCGKVATPVHVMDKATKLETIHDRIELVRIRAEIIRRDLEMQALRSSGDAKGVTASGSDRRADAGDHLENDLDFLAQCNIGGEFMEEAKKERIRQIHGAYRWMDGQVTNRV